MGASTKPTHLRARHTRCSSWAKSAEAVVWSTRTDPEAIASSTPPSPVVTERTSSSLPTHTNTKLGVGSCARRRRRGCAAMLGHPGLGLRRGAVVDGDVMAGGDQMASHRIAHHPQPHECHNRPLDPSLKNASVEVREYPNNATRR